MFYVYCTFLENGQLYIGSCTRKNAEQTVESYFGSPAKKDDNWKPVRKEIWGWFESRKEALEFEAELHAFHDVANNPLFYNRARLWTPAYTTAGRTRTQEHCAKISMANKGRKRSAEQKNKISAKVKGENNPMFGKKHTLQALQKRASPCAFYNKSSGIVHCWGLNEFARLNGCSASALSLVQTGKRLQHKGWILAIEGVHFCSLK